MLDSEEVCNLVTQNMMAFIDNGILQRSYLYEAFRLATRASMRMTCVNLELPNWDIKLKRDRLIGVSLTGWQDMVNALNMPIVEQKELLAKLRFVVHDEAYCYAQELNINEPLLKTCVKPEGTLSQLPTVSSGVHFSHSPYYLRRVRMNAIEPLVEVCKELGYTIYNEVGQTDENCKTKVVEFPIKAPLGKTKYDVSAIEQLEIYKMFMECFTDFNTSITVHVRENEWDDVEQWIWDNWDTVVGVSFIPLDDSFYELLPYESITKEQYEEKIKDMKKFNPSLIEKYEKVEMDTDVVDDTCVGGCPVR